MRTQSTKKKNGGEGQRKICVSMAPAIRRRSWSEVTVVSNGARAPRQSLPHYTSSTPPFCRELRPCRHWCYNFIFISLQEKIHRGLGVERELSGHMRWTLEADRR